jgi:hypothetical protein
MPMTKARRQHLVIAWCGIVFATVATVALEILLLADSAPLAATVTATVALIIGAFVTRRVLAPIKRAGITVGDLRARARHG